MRYSKGAATLLSTVFTFGVKSGVVADDIFDSSSKLLRGTDMAANGLTATPTSGPTSAVTKQNSVAADAGILENPAATSAGGTDVIDSSSEITIASTTCDEFVTCRNGLDIRDPTGGTSCFDSCVDNTGAQVCCAYNDVAGDYFNACEGFTGKVCKDGFSCNGYRACYGANIPSVVKSCIGDFACYKAGAVGGSIGNVNDSCEGASACRRLAYHNGKVGNVLNSCIGEDACEDAAHDGGLIGSITDSCKAEGATEVIGACSSLAFRYGIVGNVLNSCKGELACEDGAFHGGTIGSITRSCYGLRACDSLGESGDVGNINNACTATYSCYYGGAYGGIIGNIVSSCTADDACRDLGKGQGKVGHVTNSCTGTESCQYAGSNRGAIGSITQSCNADIACDGAGSGPSGDITSNLNNCCNAYEACDDVTQATLPATCKAPAPTPPGPSPRPPASKVRECILYLQCPHRQLSMSIM
jgi:hypothetical protein